MAGLVNVHVPDEPAVPDEPVFFQARLLLVMSKIVLGHPYKKKNKTWKRQKEISKKNLNFLGMKYHPRRKFRTLPQMFKNPKFFWSQIQQIEKNQKKKKKMEKRKKQKLSHLEAKKYQFFTQLSIQRKGIISPRPEIKFGPKLPNEC